MTLPEGQRILIASDVRVVWRDGAAMATHPAGRHATFAVIAEALGSATVISRHSTINPDGHVLAGPMTGPRVGHVGVPDYASAVGLLRAFPATIGQVWRQVGAHDAVFVRVPEPLSLLVALIALIRRVPVVANVVADPGTLEVPRAVKPLRALVVAVTRTVVRRSRAVVYVTREVLQKHYPAASGTPVLSRSNVEVTEVTEARGRRHGDGMRIVLVGTNTRLSKGQDVAVEAVSLLVGRGIDATLDLVGGGDHTEWLAARAADLGVADRVRVRGHVSDPAVLREVYDAADVFCLPSRSEGLPRSMVEAMSRGLPGVGSREGGIPELLPEAFVMEEVTGEELARRVAPLMLEADYRAASVHAVHMSQDIVDGARPRVLTEFLRTVLGPGRSDRCE